MKKIISILLVCTMLLLSSASVFATETETESYDLSELFADYKEYSLSEMVKYIGSHPEIYHFISYLRYQYMNYYYNQHQIQVHMSGEYSRTEVFNAFATKFVSDNISKYLIWGSRPTTPDSQTMSSYFTLDEMGNKWFTIEIDRDFVAYMNSLSSTERNRMILNFLMNLMGDDVVGLSVYKYYPYAFIGVEFDLTLVDENYDVRSLLGDCNGDGSVNAIDSNLIKKAVVGYENRIDPFAVDMNSDGVVNAIDSFSLKTKIVKG